MQVAAIVAGTGTVESLRHGGASDEELVQADGLVTVQFHTYEYPGWQVSNDRNPTSHRHEPPYGLVTADVPAGEHHVSLRMESARPRMLGGVISLAAGLIIAVKLLGKQIWGSLLRGG